MSGKVEGRISGINDKKVNTIGIILGFIFIIVLVTFVVGDAMLGATTGIAKTGTDIEQARISFCAMNGMELRTEVVQKCSLFGCHTAEQKYCVNDKTEMKIDYDHKIFCEVSLYDDIIGC